jgi:hypothetical protein
VREVPRLLDRTAAKAGIARDAPVGRLTPPQATAFRAMDGPDHEAEGWARQVLVRCSRETATTVKAYGY